jgi:predicted alpha/beta superfamily hydrolase
MKHLHPHRTILLNLLLLAATNLSAQFSTTVKTDSSVTIGDKFEIYILTPAGFHPDSTYRLVFFLDANLRSGRLLRRMLTTDEFNQSLQRIIFVGVGHTGNYRPRRRRDFLLQEKKNEGRVDRIYARGQADRFYSYLREELYLSINSRYKIDPEKVSLLGHSYGGLFVVYCLFQQEPLFSNYFALSPSLWVRHHSIYKYNKIDSGFLNKKHLYFTAGTREQLNKILPGTKRLKKYLDSSPFRGLDYEYTTWKRKKHFSALEPSLRKIFRDKL